jgi:hypothetical protein
MDKCKEIPHNAYRHNTTMLLEADHYQVTGRICKAMGARCSVLLGNKLQEG